MDVETLEGTWEEIAEHSEELAGRRVQVTVLPQANPDNKDKPRSIEEWLDQFDAWVSSFRTDVPALPDEALRREAMYEERGL